MLIQTLAANLAARAFAETEFVTDKRGAEIAALLGWPFGQVRTALEDWPADGLTHIWALGKLVACALQEQPFVQFDGDVLVFKPLPKRLTRHRLIAQSPDFPHYYTSREMLAAQALAGFAPGGAAYNAGLLGGNDVALVRAYAWAGLDLAQKFRGCALNGTSTSMIVEQYQLGVFSRRVGVEVGTLLAARTDAEAGGEGRLRASHRRREARGQVDRQSRGAARGGLSRSLRALPGRVAAPGAARKTTCGSRRATVPRAVIAASF